MDEWEVPDHWDDTEANLWQDFVNQNPELGSDDYAMILFHHSFFDLEMPHYDRDVLNEHLVEYLEAMGIDFNDTFDWDAYDDWYNEQ